MISPSQIVIDMTGVPAAAQAVVTAIDAQLSPWPISQRQKSINIDLTQIAGSLSTKQQAVDRIITGYRKLGWSVDYDRQNTTETLRVLLFALPD